MSNLRKNLCYIFFVFLCITNSLFGMESMQAPLSKRIEFVVSPNGRFFGKICSPFQIMVLDRYNKKINIIKYDKDIADFYFNLHNRIDCIFKGEESDISDMQKKVPISFYIGPNGRYLYSAFTRAKDALLFYDLKEKKWGVLKLAGKIVRAKIGYYSVDDIKKFGGHCLCYILGNKEKTIVEKKLLILGYSKAINDEIPNNLMAHFKDLTQKRKITKREIDYWHSIFSMALSYSPLREMSISEVVIENLLGGNTNQNALSVPLPQSVVRCDLEKIVGHNYANYENQEKFEAENMAGQFYPQYPQQPTVRVEQYPTVRAEQQQPVMKNVNKDVDTFNSISLESSGGRYFVKVMDVYKKILILDKVRASFISFNYPFRGVHDLVFVDSKLSKDGNRLFLLLRKNTTGQKCSCSVDLRSAKCGLYTDWPSDKHVASEEQCHSMLVMLAYSSNYYATVFENKRLVVFDHAYSMIKTCWLGDVAGATSIKNITFNKESLTVTFEGNVPSCEIALKENVMYPGYTVCWAQDENGYACSRMFRNLQDYLKHQATHTQRNLPEAQNKATQNVEQVKKTLIPKKRKRSFIDALGIASKEDNLQPVKKKRKLEDQKK